MIEPRITSIRFYSGTVRKKPKTGDRRVTKKYGEQIRVPRMVRNHISGAVIGYDFTGGSQKFDWVSPEEAYQRYPHLKDKK